MRYILATIVLTIASSLVTLAQKGETLVDLQFGNGVHSLIYGPVGRNAESGTSLLGDVQKRWGCNFGGVLTHYLGNQWGIEAGIRCNLLQSVCALNGKDVNTERDVVNGLDFTRKTTFIDWMERQTSFILSIPVGPAFKTELGDKTDVYAACGVELLLPIFSRYKVTHGRVETAGCYGDYYLSFEDMPEHGFGTYEERPSGTIGTKIGTAIFADAGLRFHMRRLSFNTGAYFSYGLSSMQKSSQSLLCKLDDYSGLLNSDRVEAVHPLVFGLKVGVTFGGKKKNGWLL